MTVTPQDQIQLNSPSHARASQRLPIDELNNNNNSEDEILNIWRCASRERTRQSLTIESLSSSNLKRLQRLHARRKTLPDNIFSQLKVKCDQVQSQRLFTAPSPPPTQREDNHLNKPLSEEQDFKINRTDRPTLLNQRRKRCPRQLNPRGKEIHHTSGLDAKDEKKLIDEKKLLLPHINNGFSQERNNNKDLRAKSSNSLKKVTPAHKGHIKQYPKIRIEK